jgi:hypothetical protein
VLIAAMGGATVNIVFINQFQRIAPAHPAIRRRKRKRGPDAVCHHYQDLFKKA